MALDAVTRRLERITKTLEEAAVPYALVGGQAVALWVASKEPAAVRTTKDVDILLRREDLPGARAAALKVDMEYFESDPPMPPLGKGGHGGVGVGMFLEKTDPNPRHAVHLVWAGEKVRPENPLPAPTVDQCLVLEPGKHVVTLPGLILMKLMANRDQDRLHLRDMIDVGLVERPLLSQFSGELAQRLDALLAEAGR